MQYVSMMIVQFIVQHNQDNWFSSHLIYCTTSTDHQTDRRTHLFTLWSNYYTVNNCQLYFTTSRAKLRPVRFTILYRNVLYCAAENHTDCSTIQYTWYSTANSKCCIRLYMVWWVHIHCSIYTVYAKCDIVHYQVLYCDYIHQTYHSFYFLTSPCAINIGIKH